MCVCVCECVSEWSLYKCIFILQILDMFLDVSAILIYEFIRMLLENQRK